MGKIVPNVGETPLVNMVRVWNGLPQNIRNEKKPSLAKKKIAMYAKEKALEHLLIPQMKMF